MAKILRTLTQILFLLLFIMLVITDKIQIWMGIFLLSFILALFLGRFYCSWLCPINTVMNMVTKVKIKFHLKSIPVPQFIKKPLFRYGMLIAFILAFAFVMASSRKLPILPTLFAVGVILTAFFPENLWHRYLCPYGTILQAIGKLSKRSYSINDSLCISCGICYRVCPSDAIQMNENSRKKYSINRSECLVCGKCAEVCPKNVIRYQ